MIETFANDKGETVYRLRKVTDFIHLPEHLVEEALRQLPVLIHSARLLLATAGDDYEDLCLNMRDYIDFVDDKELAVTFKIESSGDQLAKITMREEGDRNAEDIA